MPTLAPLPSKPPPEDPEELELPLPPAAAELEFEVEFLLEEQALTARVAAAPSTMRPSARLRMGIPAFPFRDPRPLNVVGGNISPN